jgi:two-component system OmpR family response regulator
MHSAPHILIVDDHAELRELVTATLSREGYRVSAAANGKAMREALATGDVDLVLLDWMLPGEDGLTLCRAIRAQSRVAVIMLTARRDEADRVAGLEAGADDYLPKPFGGRELIARIRAVLRRAPERPGPAEPRTLRFGPWTLDGALRALTHQRGETIPLSAGEYELMAAFVARPQRVLSRELLLDLTGADAYDRSIDTQISRLRKKLEANPARPEIIKTVWGGGYMLTLPVEGDQ